MLGRTDRSLLGVWWWTVDRWLLMAAILLMVIGTLMVMAASPPVATRISLPEFHFVWRQLIYLAPAAVAIFVLSFMSPRLIRILSLIGLLGVIGLMSLTLILGPEVKGATRWITIGPVNLQPSEFAKPLFAVVCAWLLSLWREDDDFPGWAWATSLAGIIIAILVLQPDIGMTSVIAMTWGFQTFLAGMPLLLVLIAIGLAPIALFAAYHYLDHVKSRITKFFDGGSMQSELSIRSFADGGFLGVGPGDGKVKEYLPDAHADFIFSVAAEEYGLLVCLGIIALYGFTVFRGFERSAAGDNLFCLIAGAGLAMQFGLQAAIHMASSVDLIPTKGMTLPLISYGGSSLLASGITIGMLLALTRRRQREGGLDG
ncbi:MAG: FtsW/RodA/SpoVE family cell cycle protein [Candidatus Puniceispirillaceae bacterium]